MLGKTREIWKPITKAVAKPFAALGIPPNLFSFFGVILALIAAYFISMDKLLVGGIFALLAVSIDLFDGQVAKLQGKESLFGNYFETMMDKVVEIILFIGVAFLYPLAAIVALGFSMLASYAKPRVGLVIITDNRDWLSLGEHSERMLIFVLALFLSQIFSHIMGFPTLEVALWLIAGITFVGSIQRILYAKWLIEEAEKKGSILPYLKK
ncbi:CDP-alcohol phosphatidyltransferase family protein [archaeon]|nr:CDP-alcohol phosphatidyltransferase family protein [archaeon]